jgi:hypothetical protein
MSGVIHHFADLYALRRRDHVAVLTREQRDGVRSRATLAQLVFALPDRERNEPSIWATQPVGRDEAFL